MYGVETVVRKQRATGTTRLQHTWEDPVPINRIKPQPTAPNGRKKKKQPTFTAVPEEYSTSMMLSRLGAHCQHVRTLLSPAFILIQGEESVVPGRGKTLVLPPCLDFKQL